MNLLIALLCGLLFGSGLTISQMINPNKVLGFLDFTGNWDPSLAFVMIGALAVTWIGYRFVLRQSHPVFEKKFFVSENKMIDMRLLAGAAIFGIGWGAAGYCPGPAVTALGLGIMDAFYFMVGMIISLFLFSIVKIK